jgi:hypothetical protein
MYILFLPAIIAYIVIIGIFIKNDLNAFTARLLRFAAVYFVALVALVLASSKILSAMGR